MTSINKVAVAIGMIISLLTLSVNAQTTEPELNKFATAGVSFSYPAGYAVTDESTEAAQQFVIGRRGKSAQLTIIVVRAMTMGDEMPDALERFKELLVRNAEMTLADDNASKGTPIAMQFGTRQAEGVQLRSQGNRNRIADVVWLRWNFRLVALTFIRSAVEDAAEARLWEIVRSSLKIEAPVVAATKAEASDSTPASTSDSTTSSTKRPISGGVLNGKALALPKPAYPAIARAAHAAGTVIVQVLIDEGGNVVDARAVSGHPLLLGAAVAAAREAKFSPTRLEGEPVKVTGVIQYNFVAQ